MRWNRDGVDLDVLQVEHQGGYGPIFQGRGMAVVSYGGTQHRTGHLFHALNSDLHGSATRSHLTTGSHPTDSTDSACPGASLKNPLEMKSMPHPSIHSKQVAVKGGGMRGRG